MSEGSGALRDAAQSLVDALPYEPGSALGGKIALVIAALAARPATRPRRGGGACAGPQGQRGVFPDGTTNRAAIDFDRDTAAVPVEGLDDLEAAVMGAIDDCPEVGWDESRTSDLRPEDVKAAVRAAFVAHRAVPASAKPMTPQVARQLEFDRAKGLGGVRPDDDEQRRLRAVPASAEEG